MDWQSHYKVLSAYNWLVLLVLSTLSYFLTTASFTTGVILGGLVVIANFNFMQHSISRAFSSGATTGKTKVFIIAKFYLRLLALGVILYCLLRWEWAGPVGLAVGLSTVFFSIVIFAVQRAWRTKIGRGT